MKRNKEGKMPQITRETYKSVKKFDRQQFETFCCDLYGYGFKDGRDSVPGVDAEKICEAIATVNGIGEKRMAEIRAKIDAMFGEGGNA